VFKKRLNLMIIPHQKGKVRNINFPFAFAIVCLLFIIGILGGIGYLGYIYTQEVIDVSRIPFLEDSSKEKERKIEVMEETIPKMEKKLQEMDEKKQELYQMHRLDEAPGNEDQTTTNEKSYYETSDINAMLSTAKDIEESLLRVGEILAQDKTMADHLPTLKPTKGWIIRGFGNTVSPFTGTIQMHRGVDIVGDRGQPIWAAGDGEVIFAGMKEGYGLTVEIDHGYGFITAYAHNKNILVQVGDKVKRGEAIALMGSTGHSTGTHLHYEVRYNGQYVDPLPFMMVE
jgi:murein DD-endopeptidase MepM/ murein hydrolase activator NlpD